MDIFILKAVVNVVDDLRLKLDGTNIAFLVLLDHINDVLFSAKNMPRCIKKIADQPCYNVIFFERGQNTNIKKIVYLCLQFIKECCQIDTFSTSYFKRLFQQKKN